MSKVINKSIDTIKQGLISLKNIKKDKREYKEFLKRIKALPDDYRFVFDKIQKYMWSLAGGDGYDIISLQQNLLELFEASASDGKKVIDVTGKDVAEFCDELLLNARTYTGNMREKLNKDILKFVKDE